MLSRTPVFRMLKSAALGTAFLILFNGCDFTKASRQPDGPLSAENADSLAAPPLDTLAETVDVFDTLAYRDLNKQLSRNQPAAPWLVNEVIPMAGAILPFKRIVAFYGNLYSKRMGILGELPPDEMLDKLKKEVESWQKADSTTTVIPALHYIAVTAQRDPGQGKKYRLRMPDKEIDKIIEMAAKIDALVFLDIQVGHSTLEEEIPELRKYLQMPNVHLGIDPEYSMKGGEVPGKKVGTMDAEDINYATGYLADLVREYNLPPKVLIVHRFKKMMVTNYKQINLLPEVQVVINMDGFGNKGKKLTTYKFSVTAEPVQFAGFKIFYKNDAQDVGSTAVMQPQEVLQLHPVPVYIQYQ